MIEQVKAYWEKNPLGTLDAPAAAGTREFFQWHDKIRWAEEGNFTEHLYEFDSHQSEDVLDIGCGSGWIVRNFAKNGANIHGVDLTDTAIELTRKRLAFEGLSADLRRANAEDLPFSDNAFDYIVSSGVLHHTPDTHKAVSEAIRVLRPGGRGMISLYYRHPLLSHVLWPVTRLCINAAFGDLRSRNFRQSATVEDLVRRYDGEQNPIGKVYSRADLRRLLAGCRVDKLETHFFPARFLARNVPAPLTRALDAVFGLILYAQFTK